MNRIHLKIAIWLAVTIGTVALGLTVGLSQPRDKSARVTARRVTGLNQLKQVFKTPSPDR